MKTLAKTVDDVNIEYRVFQMGTKTFLRVRDLDAQLNVHLIEFPQPEQAIEKYNETVASLEVANEK